MNTEQQSTGDLLLQFFKGLADEHRLRIIGLLAGDEYSVGELAHILGLSLPTVSHHLARMRKLGLVNLRAEGNNRFYRLNQDMLNQMKESVFRMEEAQFTQSDNAWIDALDLEDSEKDVLRHYTENGRLMQIPVKRKKLLIVLKVLAKRFELNRHYTEAEVNEIIAAFCTDFATLRRELVDFHCLEREKDGSKYWLVSTNPAL
jgi:predicted transcriptional regulator